MAAAIESLPGARVLEGTLAATVLPGRRMHKGVALQRGRVGPVGEHARDFGVERAAGDRVEDRLQVAAASRREDGQAQRSAGHRQKGFPLYVASHKMNKSGI